MEFQREFPRQFTISAVSASPTILISTALAAEAGPLVRHFRLKSVTDSRLKCWRDDRLCVLQTGIGSLNASTRLGAALSWLCPEPSSLSPVCVNLGVAGCDQPLGSLFVASKVTDNASTQSWYPQLTFNPTAPEMQVRTLSRPSRQYRQDTAFDMEASGFMNAALHFTSLEFTQCYKVISDNPGSPPDTLDESLITELIGDNVGRFDDELQQLVELSDQRPDSVGIEALEQRLYRSHRFSPSNRSNLRRLLWRHRNRLGTLPEVETLERLSSVREILQLIERSASQPGPDR